MHIQINLHGDETPEQLARVHKMLGAYRGVSDKVGEVNLELRVNSDSAILELEKFKRAVGDLDIPESVGEKLEVERVDADAATLAKLEAENPQFGKQPLPTGVSPLAPSAPSPAAAAPSTSAPAAPPGSSVDVDKNGFPWDERIHASSRAKIADGSWRMKRGVQQHVVDEVEAQLRGQTHGSAALDADALKLAAKAAGIIREVQPDAPPAPPGPPAPPAAPVAGVGLTFGQLAKRVGAKITLRELTAQDLGTQMAALGFPGGLHEANARPDMWATILETLGA